MKNEKNNRIRRDKMNYTYQVLADCTCEVSESLANANIFTFGYVHPIQLALFWISGILFLMLAAFIWSHLPFSK